MQQFQVPQFITVEDKIIGPFTLKQFAFIGSGALLILFLGTIFQGFVFYVLMVFVGSLATSLAFLKINEQSLPLIIKNAFFYFIHPRLYIWKQEVAKKQSPKEAVKTPTVGITSMPKLSVSKLSDLAWSLDLKDKIRPDK